VLLFDVPKHIILSCSNFVIHTHSRRCGNPCLFFNVSRWWCSDPFSIHIVL